MNEIIELLRSEEIDIPDDKLESLNAGLARIELERAVKKALDNVDFTSDYARKGIEDELKAACLVMKDGVPEGLDEALEKLREKAPDAFADGIRAVDIPPSGGINVRSEHGIRAVMGLA